MDLGLPAFAAGDEPENVGVAEAGAAGVVSPAAGPANGSPGAASSAAVKMGTVATIGILAGLLVVGNLAQEKEAIPVGDGVFKIRPFTIVTIGIAATVFSIGTKLIFSKYRVPGVSEVFLAA